MTPPGPTPPDGGVPARREATDAEAKALASTLRMRILRVCLDQAHTNREIATVLGRDPATTLHHVRRLVETGFLAALEARRGVRGSREIPYRATGKSWSLSVPAALNSTLLDTFVEEARQVPVDQLDTTRLGLMLTEDERDTLLAELAAVLERWRRTTPETDAAPLPGARPWSLFLAVHPDPDRP